MLRYGVPPLPAGIPNTASLLINDGIGGGWVSSALVDNVLSASYVPAIVTTDGIQGNGTVGSPVQLQPSISITAVTASLKGDGSQVTGVISSSFATTAAFAQSINSSSLATTGSNIFVGNQTFSGSLYQSGTFYGDLINLAFGSTQTGTGSYLLNADDQGTIQFDTYQNIGAALQPYVNTGSFSGSFIGTVSASTITATKITASSGINLTNTQIEAVNYIDFYTGSSPAWRNGRIFWDDAQGALAVYNAEADITLQVGQENYVRARNQTGSPILNGTAVRLSGALGDRPTITKAQSIDQTALLSNRNDIVGVATHDIEHGTDGYVTTQGLVNGLNTDAYEAGDLLWVSQTAGELTNQVPDAPYDKIFIGVVTRKNTNNGSIFVFPRQSMHFHDLSSVSSSLYTQGDIFVYQVSGSSGVWTNTKQLSGSYSFTGSLNITGALSGSPNITVASNIVPVSSGTISLGSLDKPFKEIFVGSGSISIASPISGDPATVISNNAGNLEISAGGIRLLGTGSFIAATGSFEYVSGNVTWEGNSNQLGYISASNGFTGSFTGSFYGNDNLTKYYGVFSDETLQTASAINTEAAIRFGNTHEANGISIVSGSQIKVTKAGVYDIAYTAQYHKTTNPSVTVSNWLKRTGSNVDKTNVDFIMPNNTNYHTFVNFYTLYLNANEYVEIMYSDGATFQLSGTGAQITPTRPSTPSVRLKITKL